MKKCRTILTALAGWVLSVYSQEMFGQGQQLDFDSEPEYYFWEKGKTNSFNLFRATDARSTEGLRAWNTLLAELDHKALRHGKSLKLLRQLFQKAHQHVLKKYKQYSTFNNMLESGRYDCVSGSAVLGILLERYGFEYEIIETDFHVFLVATLGTSKIILESTLPVGGIITSPSKVVEYLESYKPKDLSSPIRPLAGPVIDYSDTSIFRPVSLTQLVGLQYYNEAIAYFNKQEYGKAIQQLTKAVRLYPAERIQGLKELSIGLAAGKATAPAVWKNRGQSPTGSSPTPK